MDVIAAVVREHAAPFTIEDVRLDDPQSDEILVRVVAVGICHTDLAVQRGHIPVPLPAVLGHEGAGIVEAVGTGVVDLSPGDHVILSQVLCGSCARCTGGEPAYCEHAARLSLGGRREDGTTPISDGDGPISSNFVGQSSFATSAIVKARNAFRIDDDLPLATLAPIGCGVMTGAGAVVNDGGIAPGDAVAVFGCGTVGLAAIMAAKVLQAERIIAVDVNPARLELAAKLGATDTLAVGDAAVADVHRLTGGGVDLAVEAAGSPAAATAAIGSTHTRGRTVIVGAAPFGSTLDVDWWTLAAGRTVQGSVIGSSNPPVDIARLVQWWRDGELPIEDLETRYRFDEINDAVIAMAAGDVVKPVIVMDASGGGTATSDRSASSGANPEKSHPPASATESRNHRA